MRQKNHGVLTNYGFAKKKKKKKKKIRSPYSESLTQFTIMGFDIKFGFGICICNKEEKSWVFDKVWICINKEIKGNEAEK